MGPIKAYLDAVNPRQTPQTEPIPGSSQVENSAGGYSFAVDDFTRLERFLVLGSEGGSYYASERKLTLENAKCVERCLRLDGLKTVELIATISEQGRAPKNDPAIFALMLALKRGDKPTRRAATGAFNRVIRIGTHLFQAAEAVKALGGWGRNTRRAFAGWYANKDPNNLAYQLVKYRQREGWSHRDVLRKVHVKPPTQLLRWAVGKPAEGLPNIIEAFERARRADVKGVVGLIERHGLPREAIPTEHLNSKEVWEALLMGGAGGMPMTAMMRNLGKMTSIGLLTEGSEAARYVACRFLAVGEIVGAGFKSRGEVHPLSILLALKTYACGMGLKGSLVWNPVRRIVDALNDAFYSSFKLVEPSGKRLMVALDVSGSMGTGQVGGTPLTPIEAAAALALLALNTEKDVSLYAFSHEFREAPLSKNDRLDEAARRLLGMGFGGTDCALPMVHALKSKDKFDAFHVYTDSETYAGRIHPAQALKEYRRQSGIAAKLVVVGMVSNGFTIADPNDAGMMDVVGFDTSAPSVVADFTRA